MSSAAKKIDHPFRNSEVINNLSHGVVETLKLMAQIESSFGKVYAEKNWQSPNAVCVYLDLVSEPYTGQIRFHFTKKALAAVCKNMMEMDLNEDSPELIDGLGEIANIFYGYAKGKLNSQGFDLQMTLPFPGYIQDMPEVFSSIPHIIVPFYIMDELCHIQIIVC